MSDPLKQFIRKARRASTERDVIATGRAMAEHCDARIERAASELGLLAGDVDATAADETNDKGAARALKAVAHRIRAIRAELEGSAST